MTNGVWLIKVGGCAFVWACLCLSLSTSAPSTGSLVGVVTQCQPEGGYPQINFTASFELLCAITCRQRHALYFTFDGGRSTCTVVGEGVGYNSTSAVYIWSPQPEMLEEVANGKTTYASPQWGSYYKYLAVDGNEGISSVSISADYTVRPWWLVDLGQPRTVYKIIILPRYDYAPTRFHDIEVRVGNALITSGNVTSYTMFSTYKGPYTAAQGHLRCDRMDGIIGRYISIQRVDAGLDLLQINEAYIWAVKL